MAVEHVTSDAEYLAVAYVEVEAERLRRCDAVAAAETAEAARRTVGKARVVDIVCAAEYGELVAVPEAVDDKGAFVAVVGAISGFGVAKPAIVHTFLDGKVYDGFVVAIVDTRQACQVALAVNHLQLVGHVYGQVTRGHGGVVAEEVFAVDEDFLDFLTVYCDFAFAIDFCAGETFHEVLDNGVGLSLIRVGVKLHGVLHHLDWRLDAGDDGLL